MKIYNFLIAVLSITISLGIDATERTKKRAALNQTNLNSKLLKAALSGNEQEARKLCLQGANPNHLLGHPKDSPQDSYEPFTPLTKAITKKNEPAVKILLFVGADPNQSNEQGTTPLMFAARLPKPSIAASLLQSGARINQADNNGFTPLMVAALHIHEETTQFLIEHGANINQTNDDGATALMYGLKRRMTAMLEQCLKRQVDLTLKNKRGETIYDFLDYSSRSPYLRCKDPEVEKQHHMLDTYKDECEKKSNAMNCENDHADPLAALIQATQAASSSSSAGASAPDNGSAVSAMDIDGDTEHPLHTLMRAARLYNNPKQFRSPPSSSTFGLAPKPKEKNVPSLKNSNDMDIDHE